ncbi:MAG: ABC transporter substrate-binding protein [Lachnospiraceae bacterium]|nr:ABC transporter substrate-binding protein [Lachnospiraceae bacterium]
MIKKIFAALLSVLMVISLVACGNKQAGAANQSASTEEKVYKIGTLQLVQHAALDASYNGFVDYLNEKGIKFTMDFQNASGEQSACETIAEKFANDNLDLCYAIATPAAQSIVAHLETTPIVASAVTDPAASGLCQTNDNPRGMLTAVSDLTPVDAQFELLVELLPNAKNVGVLYCSAEQNSKIQADMALAAAKARNLNATEYTVVNSNDIQTVVESMVGKVDVIYVPTDNVISAGIDTVVTICNENKLPTIVGEEGMVDKGGFATYGIDYYSLGRVAGELAETILVNKIKPGDIPVRYLSAESCKRKINYETAKILGIEVN